MSGVDVLAVMDELEGREGFCGESDVRRMKIRQASAAVAELIEERDALAKWQREVVPLLAAAQSWMPAKKCAAHIREIDAALARVGGAV